MKIAIDCGHTLNGADYGASGVKEESILTREVGRKVINLFKDLGHTIIDCTVDNAASLNASLVQRCQKANNAAADYYISIHFNAFNGEAKGTEILYYSSADERMKRILSNICSLGYTNRGLKQRANLAVLKNTSMAAMLIECCFCDNKEDMAIYNADKLAKAIVEGFFNTNIVDKKEPAAATNKISTHLKDFQKAYNESYNKNILVDGLIGPQTEAAIKNVILKKGSKNALVGWVQCRTGAAIDNIFGSGTEAKVKQFQKDQGLAADGIVGYNTIKTILKIYNW